MVVAVEGGVVRLVECRSERICRLMEEHGSLRDGVLDPLEAAYQAARGRVYLGGATGWEAALSIVSSTGVPVDLFLVYYDLRRRGRRVRRGVRPGTLLVDYGGRKVEILVLSEGVRVPLWRLASWSRLAAGDGYEPVVAVVDSYGRPTYYTARASTSLY